MIRSLLVSMSTGFWVDDISLRYLQQFANTFSLVLSLQSNYLTRHI
uniref:Uncharacterized protein n=1 Tax=Anguilla anguilla TaxID=7936 RepID=A0A0E9W2T7_ANGAN